jgi:hypothetical protein
VIDHLPNPYESLEYCIKALRKNGVLICDWERMKVDGEDQHLMRYDAQTFQHWMKDRGMYCTPDKAWLFIKEGEQNGMG